MTTVFGQLNMHMLLDNSNTVTVVNLECEQESYIEIQININEILTQNSELSTASYLKLLYQYTKDHK